MRFVIKSIKVFIALTLSVLINSQALADYTQRSDVQQFASDFAQKHGADKQKILAILAKGEKQDKIIESISRPAERTLTWGDYRRIFIEEKRLDSGVAFWLEHYELFQKVAEQYEVEPHMILAILGVETRYGKIAGSYRVLDALLTLGFDYPPRAKFFRGQLEQFLLLVDEQKLDPFQLTGSYAGAMGYGQFIPSSYRAYAVDFDGDKKADIWHNTADAVASVANYFARHKWKIGEPVAWQLVGQSIDDSLVTNKLKPNTTVGDLRKSGVEIPMQFDDANKVTLMKLETPRGEEYWLGFENFYAITRYNHSSLYAMAAFQLSELIRYSMDMRQ